MLSSHRSPLYVRWWLVFTVFVLFAVAAVGCVATVEVPQTESVQEDAASEAQTRLVKHFGGETEIPATPQRPVALNGALGLWPLGIKPVGAPAPSEFEKGWIPEEIGGAEWYDGIADVGWDPNLEAVTALNPDLIVGADWHMDQYEQLSAIAPTVLVEFNHSGRWKEYARQEADFLNALDAYNEYMDWYETRIEEIKSRMTVPPEEISVSVVRVYEDSLTLYTRGGFLGQVLKDFGFKRPPSQDLSAEESGEWQIQYLITFEELEKADADVLILVITQRADPTRQDQVDKLKESLLNHPLWPKLQVVEAGRVEEVGFAWISDIGAVHIVLDDIERIFVENDIMSQ
ncbi:MAG: iron-siderophore ABC transporter substrate-binding protein [Caldilineaceae bacterium SB0661_bin_32]|uniref:Iron-siderophore ABC transporter substrate-binding protein n=1 Tax=Caldilineaceae bacterium SB0661_bin_32 TaxID=2605255 RepID=A0A6B1DCC7_9CHLR|nr:iron-siderophore ABC transporter substrate-binding protein [Caldilineaceae bacterium SB0661_bin_32]